MGNSHAVKLLTDPFRIAPQTVPLEYVVQVARMGDVVDSCHTEADFPLYSEGEQFMDSHLASHQVVKKSLKGFSAQRQMTVRLDYQACSQCMMTALPPRHATLRQYAHVPVHHDQQARGRFDLAVQQLLQIHYAGTTFLRK